MVRELVVQVLFIYPAHRLPPNLAGWMGPTTDYTRIATHTHRYVDRGVERSDGKHTWMSELIVSWIQSLLVAHGVKQVGKLRPPRHAGHEQLIARKAHLAVKKRRTRGKKKDINYLCLPKKKQKNNPC